MKSQIWDRCLAVKKSPWNSINSLLKLGLLASMCLSPPLQAARFVANLPECQTSEFLALLDINHDNGDFSVLESDLTLMEKCTLPPEDQRDQTRVAQPERGLINFETAQAHPLELTPDGERLLAVNTAANTLEIFSTTSDQLLLLDSVPVGHDPVSVRALSNTEAWVVNSISDSVSVVDLRLGAVMKTLQTDNEPADVIFAEGQQRAFVSSGEKNSVQVFDLANLDTDPQRILLAMEEPRALAISSDGSTVFVAAYESGNGTTAINGRSTATASGSSQNIVSRADSPYSGTNPAPNLGNNFEPALTAGDPGEVGSLIVRKNDSGQWVDDNNHDWTSFVSGAQAPLSGRVVGWDLQDHDLAQINTQSLAVTYTSRLMNINAAVAVSPLDGRVIVVGTDATNEVRYQPNLNGTFLRVLYAGVGATQPVEVTDLNPHLDYSVPTVDAAERARSVGDPRGVVWDPDGSRFFVSGMGSNNVIAVSSTGDRLGRLDVGQGPTGVVLSSQGEIGYVLNRFDGSISSFDTETFDVLQTVAFYDPTPDVVKAGRPHLYDTHEGSGLGHMSCASCHVDARTDRLAWDLSVPNGSFSNGSHPMKGSMQTQSLMDIIRFPNFHWRGDRLEMLDFNPTFTQLQGAASQLNGAEISELEAFLSSLHFPPNPYRNIDNSLSDEVSLPEGAPAGVGDAIQGRGLLNACIGCHSNGLSRSNQSMEIFGQSFTPAAFHGFYKRFGYRADSATESSSGFGFFHDGADSLMTVARSADLLAALMSFDGPDNGLSLAQSRQDTHAAVGQQLTITVASDFQQLEKLTQMLQLADSVHLDLIAKRGGKVSRRGYLYSGAQSWQSDRESETKSHSSLLASADASHPITFTLVVAGTGQRLALDYDLDGVFDHAGTNLAPVFGFTGIRASKIGEPESYQLPATDPDGDAMSFSASGLPAGLQLNSQTGVISGTPTQLGESIVLVEVSDGEDADSINVIWRVVEELPVGPAVQIGAGLGSGSLAGLFFLLLFLLPLQRRAARRLH